MMKAVAMRADAAETLALRALAWVAADEVLLARLVAETGIDAAEMRARADEPEFLGFVLDFLLADEAALLGFCASEDIPPELPGQARVVLPGGDLPSWT